MDEDSPSRTTSRLKHGQPRGADKIYANNDVLPVDQEGLGELRHKYQVSKYFASVPMYWYRDRYCLHINLIRKPRRLVNREEGWLEVMYDRDKIPYSQFLSMVK
jgi:hypothetical protein